MGALKALPNTLEAAKQGWISVDHARLMGESHQRAPLTDAEELELITLAISEDLDDFKKTVARREDQRRADDGLTRHERQRERRSTKVFDGDNDMVIVYAELDRLAGDRFKTALHDFSDRLFREDAKNGSDRTHERRNADALVALVTQKPGRTGSSADSDNGSDCEIAPQATTLIVTVDYDTLSGQLKDAGLVDGTPVDIDDLRHIACDAGIVPAIFAADGQPLYLGRKQRAVTAAQKLALIARDKQCVGCGMRASACDAHHIIWWDDNGPTDITNLVLLCPKCHKKVHKPRLPSDHESQRAASIEVSEAPFHRTATPRTNPHRRLALPSASAKPFPPSIHRVRTSWGKDWRVCSGLSCLLDPSQH